MEIGRGLRGLHPERLPIQVDHGITEREMTETGVRTHAESREASGSLDLTRIFVEALADLRARSDQRAAQLTQKAFDCLRGKMDGAAPSVHLKSCVREGAKLKSYYGCWQRAPRAQNLSLTACP